MGTKRENNVYENLVNDMKKGTFEQKLDPVIAGFVL